MTTKKRSHPKEIPITCTGSRYVPFGTLKDFQGKLKDLARDDLDKLKRQILKRGFSFPYYVWRDFILDGHQRTHALKELLSEGYTIGPVPVVDIEAVSEKEAAEKLLALNSHFGRITYEGLYEFVNLKEVDLSSDLAGDLSLPDIDMDKWLAGYGEEGGGSDGNPGDDIVPEKDSNILVRLSFHPGMWLGKREEIMGVFDKMAKAYECTVKVEE